jgi:hypothetical protein
MTNDEASRLEEILATVADIRSKLPPRAREFIEDIEARYDEHGADLRLSAGQWKWLEDLYNKA